MYEIEIIFSLCILATVIYVVILSFYMNTKINETEECYYSLVERIKKLEEEK